MLLRLFSDVLYGKYILKLNFALKQDFFTSKNIEIILSAHFQNIDNFNKKYHLIKKSLEFKFIFSKFRLLDPGYPFETARVRFRSQYWKFHYCWVNTGFPCGGYITNRSQTAKLGYIKQQFSSLFSVFSKFYSHLMSKPRFSKTANSEGQIFYITGKASFAFVLENEYYINTPFYHYSIKKCKYWRNFHLQMNTRNESSLWNTQNKQRKHLRRNPRSL